MQAAANLVNSPSFQSSLTATVNASMANFNPTTYAEDNPDSKQMALINMINSGNYTGAFAYAKANGMIGSMESGMGLQALSQSSDSMFGLPVSVQPFTKSQMEAYYAAAAGALSNGSLGGGPIGDCETASPAQGTSGSGDGYGIGTGCAITDPNTKSNYIWVTPTAAEADSNAASSNIPNLLGFSAIGQPPPKDSMALNVLFTVALGVMTAGAGAAVGAAVGAAAGIAAGTATTIAGDVVVGAATGAIDAAAEGGNIGLGALGGAIGGGITGGLSSPGVNSAINGVAENVTGNAVVDGVDVGSALSRGFEGAVGGAAVSAATGRGIGVGALSGGLAGSLTSTEQNLLSSNLINNLGTQTLAGAATGAAVAAATGQNIGL